MFDKFWLFIVSVFTLLSCTTLNGPLFEETTIAIKEDAATVVVYRERSAAGAAWANPIYLNRIKFIDLDAGGFGYTFADPGMNTVSYGSDSDPEFRKVSILMSAGETYYVKLSRGFPDTFRLVPEAEALQALTSEKFRLQY